MLHTARRWALFTLAACVLMMAACVLTVYTVDPFEQYRESSILPLYDQESYNNPGHKFFWVSADKDCRFLVNNRHNSTVLHRTKTTAID